MHPTSKKRPTQQQLIFPLLEFLEGEGGSAKARDASAALAERFGLPEDVIGETVRLADGQKVKLWERHVRFARQKALAMGYLASGGRGLWSLTDEGAAGLRKVSPAVTVSVILDEANRPCGAQIELEVGVPTVHTLTVGDARDLRWMETGKIPLFVSSIPYFDLKAYEAVPGQMGNAESYDDFLQQLDMVLAEVYRVLIPGGRFACNVGDVLRSRFSEPYH